jgi:hypothetical protein
MEFIRFNNLGRQITSLIYSIMSQVWKSTEQLYKHLWFHSSEIKL